MKVYVLFVHKNLFSKRKVCIIFIKIKTLKNPPKKTFLVGFFRWVFLGGFFIASPALWSLRLTSVLPVSPTCCVARVTWRNMTLLLGAAASPVSCTRSSGRRFFLPALTAKISPPSTQLWGRNSCSRLDDVRLKLLLPLSKLSFNLVTTVIVS